MKNVMSSSVEAPSVEPPLDPSPLANKTLLSYGVGQTGAQLFRDMPAVLLPLFMTTMLGISPWLAGIAVLIPKLWVIVCDPLVGALSDHYKPAWSRRPFLTIGAVVTGFSFIALFSFSEFASPEVAAFTVAVLFLIASTAFSGFSVPYLAVASELSDDAHERTKVLSVRIVFAVIGVVMGVGLAQPMVFYLGGDAAAWRTMAIVFGVISMLAMLTTAVAVPKNYGVAHHADFKALFSRFSVVRHNTPFVVLTVAFLIQSVAQAIGYAVVGFVFLYAIEDVNLLLPFILVMACGSISSQPLWLKASVRFGKERAFWLACSGWLLVTLTWATLEAGPDAMIEMGYFGSFSAEHAGVLFRGFVIGVTNAAFSVLTFSMLTDTIVSQKIAHGSVDEGVYSGIFSAVEKLGFALGPMLSGIILSYAGFQASVGGAVAQSQTAIDGMVLSYSFVPAGIMALSLLVFSRYRVKI